MTAVTISDLTATLSSIEAELTAAPDDTTALRTLTSLAVQRVEGTEFAGVTIGRPGRRFRSVGQTDPIVDAVDAIQYELHSGPCLDAVVEDDVFSTADLRSDERWPTFGRRAADETGVLSMLSYRLYFEDDHDTIAALNMYSRRTSAFDEAARTHGLVLATAGALAVSAAEARSRAEHLQRALDSNREIGIAIGVVMTRYLLTREQAFDALRLISQDTHRKIIDIAHEVADTGVVPDLAPPSSGVGG